MEEADENGCQHFRSQKAFRAKSKTDPGYSLSHQSCTVAPFRQWRHLQAGAQLYIRHCWAVFRTCSTGWTAAIAFMGARWGASHQAWSRQTLRSCSLSPKVIILYPAGLAWLPQFALLASMWALLQPHFLAVRPGKIVLLRCT